MFNFLASFVLARLCVLKSCFHTYFNTDLSVEGGWAGTMIFLRRCT